MQTAELFVVVLLTGAIAGVVTYWTHEFENWKKWAIAANSAAIVLFASKDLWSWVRYESGSFNAFIDMLATGVTPSMMLGMAALKAVTYIVGLVAGALFARREYRFY
ncbi:hypothetical protein [Paraburkholderia kururiensis]|uniref:hypothetical protein n=1 Tax=Paraburkholderia kururiensis TaxID=984307 RepID=UPI000A71D07C|nr:hypothetical protein [Paraburkholderia kururiensis]